MSARRREDTPPASPAFEGHLGDPDLAGHRSGFSPDVPEYVTSIETTDGYVGRIVQAMRLHGLLCRHHRLVERGPFCISGTVEDHMGAVTLHADKIW